LLQVGSQDRDFAFIRSCIPRPTRPFLLLCLDDHTKDRIDEAVQLFDSRYQQSCTQHTALYPGVLDFLAGYAGKKKLAVATSNLKSAVFKMLDALNATHYFDLIITADDVQRPKPDPECLNYILEALHCSRDRALMVGDTPTDILTGKNAGTATCAVTYGIGTLEELKPSEPDFVVQDILELRKIVAVQ
jgi:phosphoglycolate phosphatase